LTVTIRYFARLREEAGTDREVVQTQAATISELWTEAAGRHSFTLAAEQIRASQDDEFCPWNAPLSRGTEVVFMPPVAGG
jgi:molybdopterin synthase sulfur carrier subunit